VPRIPNVATPMLLGATCVGEYTYKEYKETGRRSGTIIHDQSKIVHSVSFQISILICSVLGVIAMGSFSQAHTV